MQISGVYSSMNTLKKQMGQQDRKNKSAFQKILEEQMKEEKDGKETSGRMPNH